VGQIQIHVDPDIPTSSDQRIATTAQLAQGDWQLHLRQAPIGVNPVGALPALPQITLYVSKGPPGPPPWRSSGEPWGWADLVTREVRLASGSCDELPGLFHAMAHIWGRAAGPPHDPNWIALDVLGQPVINAFGGRVDWPFVVAWDQVLQQFQRNAHGCP